MKLGQFTGTIVEDRQGHTKTVTLANPTMDGFYRSMLCSELGLEDPESKHSLVQLIISDFITKSLMRDESVVFLGKPFAFVKSGNWFGGHAANLIDGNFRLWNAIPGGGTIQTAITPLPDGIRADHNVTAIRGSKVRALVFGFDYSLSDILQAVDHYGNQDDVPDILGFVHGPELNGLIERIAEKDSRLKLRFWSKHPSTAESDPAITDLRKKLCLLTRY